MLLSNCINNPGKNNFSFIRLLASLLVLLTHTFTFFPAQSEPVSFLTQGLLTGSFLGVSAFFFLSGLLVTQSLRRSPSWINFLYRRFLRIYPAAWLVILSCALVLGPLMTTEPLAAYFTHPDFFRFLANCFLVRIHFTLPGVYFRSPVGPGLTSSFWSLCLEVKLYAALLVIWRLKFPGKRTVAISFVLAAFVFNLFFFRNTVSLFAGILPLSFSPFPYTLFAPLFILGVLCNLYQDRIVLKPYWMGAILLLGWPCIYFHWLIPAIFLLLPASILYAASYGHHWIKKITPKADFSYGIYIWGVPVGKWVYQILHPGNAWENFLLTTTAVLLFAAISWYGLERRMHALKNKWG